VNDDDFGSILDELLGLYPTMTTLRLRSGYGKTPHLAHGWYQRVRRSCEAIIGLEELGYGPEAAPIRRTIIEHAVALRWLAKEGNAVVDVMALEHASRGKRIQKALKEANWTAVDPNQIQTVIDEIENKTWDHTKSEFKHFTKQNDDPGVLLAYLAEVGRAHATYESAMDYMNLEPPQLLEESRAQIDSIKVAADFLLDATNSFHSMLKVPVWTITLSGLTARWRAANDRLRDQQGLPSANWGSP
jgi:hypothetical protein